MEAEVLPVASRALVRIVGLLVPLDRRADWRAGWTAELWVLRDRHHAAATPATILKCCWTAVLHAGCMAPFRIPFRSAAAKSASGSR